MIVLVVERVPPSVRGELTRWLLEPKVGVFVGNVSAMVRDKLWERVCKGLKGREGGLLAYSTDTEQGFAIRVHGETSRLVVDFEGLTLIKVP